MSNYNLKINTVGLHNQIFINEFPAFREFKGYATRVQIPINQYLKVGRNEVKMVVSSLDGQPIQTNSVCKIMVLEFENVLISVETPDFIQTPPVVNRLERIGFFYWYKPVPDFAYFDAPPFDRTIQTQHHIRNFYQYLRQIIINRDIHAFMALSQQRDVEVARAYGISLAERIADIQPFLQKILQHPHLKLRPVDLDKQLVRYYCEDKVVCLENEAGQQPIILEDDTTEIALTFYICYNQNHEFIIIR